MDALILSVRLAACVSVILLLIGMPLAYWLADWNWRGKFLLEAIVALPLVLPPTVLWFLPQFYIVSHSQCSRWLLRLKPWTADYWTHPRCWALAACARLEE